MPLTWNNVDTDYVYGAQSIGRVAPLGEGPSHPLIIRGCSALRRILVCAGDTIEPAYDAVAQV